MGTVLKHLPKISEKSINSINQCQRTTSEKISIMNSFIFCAAVLFVANVNGIPAPPVVHRRSADVADVFNIASLRAAPIVFAREMGVNSPSEGLASVEPASKRGLFDPLRRSFGYPSTTISKREEAAPTIGASNEGEAKKLVNKLSEMVGPLPEGRQLLY